jgi:hypothetical protein
MSDLKSFVPFLIGLVVRLAIMVFLITITGGLYLFFTWIFTLIAYFRENDASFESQRFSKERPFYRYGLPIFEAGYVFPSPKGKKLDENVRGKVFQAIEWSAQIQTSGTNFEELQVRKIGITDISSVKHGVYEKKFIEAATRTVNNTRLVVLFNTTIINGVANVRWWVLARGRLTFFKVLRFILVAPLGFLYWGWDKISGVYSIKAAIASDIEYTYDIFDIEDWLGIYLDRFWERLLPAMKKVGFDIQRYLESPVNFLGNIDLSQNINATGAQIGAVVGGAAKIERFSGGTLSQTNTNTADQVLVTSEFVPVEGEIEPPPPPPPPPLPPSGTSLEVYLREFESEVRTLLTKGTGDLNRKAAAQQGLDELMAELDNLHEANPQRVEALIGTISSNGGARVFQYMVNNMSDPSRKFPVAIRNLAIRLRDQYSNRPRNGG